MQWEVGGGALGGSEQQAADMPPLENVPCQSKVCQAGPQVSITLSFHEDSRYR